MNDESARPSGVELSITIDTTAANIFDIYADVERWPDWDPDLEAAGLDGSFELDSGGWIKPRGAPRMKTRITDLSPGRSFTAQARLPLCTLHFTHTIRPLNEARQAVRVTHGADFSVMLAPLFRRLIGGSISKALPAAMEGLKRHAETRDAPHREPVTRGATTARPAERTTAPPGHNT